MSDKNLILVDQDTLELPPFGKAPALRIEMDKIREAESRLIEAKTVNPSTYTDLEYSFNEAYRDLKRHLSSIGYRLIMAEKDLEEAKANVLLGSYAEFMKGKTKTQDNADLRKAFMVKNPEYCAAFDRIAQLRALESNFDGKIKVMERVCAYMKVQMNLIIRGGLSGSDLYVTKHK